MKRLVVVIALLFPLLAIANGGRDPAPTPPPQQQPPAQQPAPQPQPLTPVVQSDQNVTVNNGHRARDILIGAALAAVAVGVVIHFSKPPDEKQVQFGINVRPVER